MVKNRLQQTRAEIGLELHAVAQAVNVLPVWLQGAERGEHDLDPDQWNRLARLYQRRTSWLRGDPEPDVFLGIDTGRQAIASVLDAFRQIDRDSAMQMDLLRDHVDCMFRALHLRAQESASDVKRATELAEQYFADAGQWRARAEIAEARLKASGLTPDVQATGSAAKLAIPPLKWSDPKPPDGCAYDHVTADTPWGQYRIEWKSWKDEPGLPSGRTVFGPGPEEYIGTAYSLEEAQKIAQDDVGRKIHEFFGMPAPPAVDLEAAARALHERMEQLDPDGDPDLTWERLDADRKGFLIACAKAVLGFPPDPEGGDRA